MKPLTPVARLSVLVAVLCFTSVRITEAADPLPSWNDASTKQAIVTFVQRVTKEGSPDFVPVAERIAVFDNDGTLRSEQPMYFQAMFIVDRIRALAPQHPDGQHEEGLESRLSETINSVRPGYKFLSEAPRAN